MTLKPMPNFGDLFTIEKFEEMVRKRVITDDDGTGYFATALELSDIVARPTTILHGFSMRNTGEFIHIRWFNK